MTIYRDDLERVYALIEAPERWTQGSWARAYSDSEEGIGPHNPSAECWCLEGAFFRATGIACEPDVATQNIRHELVKALGIQGHVVSQFNDTHTHAEVLALLKAAIERAPVRP